MKEQLLQGNLLANGRFYPPGSPPALVFQDRNSGSTFGIDEASLYKNIILTGGAGSGKTNVVNQILKQTRSLQSDVNGVHIIFDTKADYYHHRGFFRPDDCCLGNSREFRDISVTWNIFDEILVDGDAPRDYEPNAREIAKVLFHDRGSKQQPFFANAARDIFANILIYFVRRSKDNPLVWKNNLNNHYLKNFLLSATPKQLEKYFSLYDDMRGLVSYFGDGSSNQALGVFGELKQMIYDCFQGVFAQQPAPGKSFSIRREIRHKRNQAIFIEYDMSVGEIMTPMYRLLIDLALKEALSENANGRVHLFLDELKLLPKLTHLQDALNFGRSKRVSVVAGIQNINQLYSTYGEYGAKEILEGFSNIIALKANDHATREYITQRFGPNITSYRYYTAGNEPVDKEREGNSVEHWDQRSLKLGQAIVGLATQEEPFLFQFSKDMFE